VLEREEIYQRVWGYAMAHGDRSVDVFVRKLRLKLQKVSPDWSYIHTHFGVGYRFAAELAVEAEIAEAVASAPAAEVVDGVAPVSGIAGPAPALTPARTPASPPKAPRAKPLGALA
jgi:DNA-binding winged helix-turn-helix (wHTH) protein